jgi:hypothetical protein
MNHDRPEELLRERDLGLAEIERNDGTEVPPDRLPEFLTM